MNYETAKGVGGRVYGGVIGLAALYGLWKGAWRWVTWKKDRKTVTVSNKTIDPVLNIGRDGGYLGYHLLVGGGSSAVLAATFPVSIPLLTFLSKEEGEEEEAEEDKEN